MPAYHQRPPYDIHAPNCPARQVLERLADKWALLLIDRLGAGERLRFNQLRREIIGISQKMLSQTLKKLERDGLVDRQVYATVPPTVEYALTELGAALGETVERLSHWAESHMQTIIEAQRAYDERNFAVAASNRAL